MMRIQPTQVYCINCKHQWTADLVVSGTIQVFIDTIRAVRCPVCDADTKQIAFVTPGKLGDEHWVNWNSPEMQP